MKSLARWCVRHRVVVLVVWLAILISVMAISNSVGTAYQSSFSLPNTQSTEALNVLQHAAPRSAGDTERIVFQVPAGQNVNDPAAKAAVSAMLQRVQSFPSVIGITSPYSPEGATQVSRDGRIAFASVSLSKGPFAYGQKEAQKFVAVATSARSSGLKIAVAGQVAENAARPSLGGTLPGVLLAGVVLLLVFGSLSAMALPLVSAMISLGTAIGIIGLLSHVLDMPTFSTELVLLIGLGVGVDYALFIVTRYRQGLLAGMSVEDAIVTAVDTSGRAVLFAGLIVCVALLGMFALGVSFLYGLAVSSALGVALTMIAALSLLPALLSFLGHRVLSRKQKRDFRENGPRIVGLGTKGFWPRWADFMRRRPIVPALVALALIALMAAPFFTMRLGHGDQGNDPTTQTTRQAYDLLAAGFGPGFNGPLQLVAVTTNSAQLDVVGRAVDAVKATPGVAFVAPEVNIPGKDGTTVTLVNVYPIGSPQAASTADLINSLRSTTLPTALKGTNVTILVGGVTAIFTDFAAVLGHKLPLFIAIVVLFSFLLLAIVFRSLVVPLTAAVMNLLSIAAGFGILTAVFQHGVLGGLFGVNRPGPIETFIPVMMFAILFGLSMDYEVFLVTRIHEEWLKSGDNTVAVRNGLAATGKTISAAAAIMVLVFGSFMLGGMLVIKEFGLGLAAGVFVDAIIIRMAIVPSVMQLLGRANWWFPMWLDRILPRLAVEPEEEEVENVPVGV
jgi:putative drug exporter of the RND superfamily